MRHVHFISSALHAESVLGIYWNAYGHMGAWNLVGDLSGNSLTENEMPRSSVSRLKFQSNRSHIAGTPDG